MPAPHHHTCLTGIASVLAASLTCHVALVGSEPAPAATPAAAAATNPAAQLPLDAAPASVIAVAWSGSAGSIGTSDCSPLPSPCTPASLFGSTLRNILQRPSGAVSTDAWAARAAPQTPADAEVLTQQWKQRLAAHRAVAGLALTPNKPTSANVVVPPPPVTIAEGLVLLNSIRQQSPEAMDTGPEARLLRAINFINARSIYVSAVLPATPASAIPAAAPGATSNPLATIPMMRLAISWSSRSEPLERCRAVVIGETAVSATDWPADITPGPWVLAIRPNAYYGSLGSGTGNYLRYAVAMDTAVKPGEGRGPDSPVTSINPSANDQCSGVARNADRTFFVSSIGGAATVLLPCRGADEAAAALTAAASLLGVPPEQVTATAWGSVKLTRMGQRSIALQLLPAK